MTETIAEHSSTRAQRQDSEDYLPSFVKITETLLWIIRLRIFVMVIFCHAYCLGEFLFISDPYPSIKDFLLYFEDKKIDSHLHSKKHARSYIIHSGTAAKFKKEGGRSLAFLGFSKW